MGTNEKGSSTIVLDDSGDVELSIQEVLTGRAFLTGKSGSGKSNTASVVVEELLDRGYPVLIVDTDGEYYGLKEEYEVLHAGGDSECEIQVGPEHGEKLADLALKRGVPIILDVSGYLDRDESDALIRETARSLFSKAKKEKRPFLLLVEEVHEYIPEKSAVADVGEALIQIAKRGRKHGLGMVGISQRPADVKKDFITQCDWLIWHRLTWENDRKVVRRVVGSETADAVRDLNDGEAVLQADWRAETVERVQVRRKRTFDAGATPDLGEFERPELKSVSGDLVDELEEISEEQQRRQDRIAQLEAENEGLRETIQRLQDELEQARDMSDMAEQFTEAMLAKSGPGEESEALEETVEEIREEKNQRIAELEQENESLREDVRELRTERADLEERLAELEEYEQAVENMDELREATHRLSEALGMDGQATETVDELRDKLTARDEEIQDLKAELQRLESQAEAPTVPTDYQEFVEEDAVQEAIDDAIEECTASPRYVKGVVATIIEQGGPVNYDTIAEYLGVSTTSDISKASSALQARSVVEKTQERPAKIDFDMDAIAEIKARNQRRERAEDIMEQL